jgi:hypothetical protein
MSQGKQETDWLAEGQNALLDLLSERLVIPWFEAESRISSTGWKSFLKVQPLQLHESRKSLADAGLTIEERTAHPTPIVTVRIPFPPNRKREITRLLGSRRKLYRKYLSWTNDERLCGRHAERVILDSLEASASNAGLYVPPQVTGRISQVKGVKVIPGPLDCFAYILELPEVRSEVTLVVEVKNINDWIYPWTKELWELLVKAAHLATHIPVVPLLVCMRSAPFLRYMALDIGFLYAQTREQIFSPSIPDLVYSIPEADFQEVVNEFGLTIIQHEGPLDSIRELLPKLLRQSPPLSPPPEEILSYKRQAYRFQTLAPVILAYRNLANKLPEDTRRNVFSGFKTAAHAALKWPALRGW